MNTAGTGWEQLRVDGSCSVDVWSCAGAKPGPVALITAGVHGDEYEGPAAVLELVGSVDPAELKGTVFAIPVANPLAFAAGSRTTPEDGLNLARVFPGKPDGSITQRIAAAIFSRYVAQSNFLIDLHSGGVEYLFTPLAGFYGKPCPDNPSYAAARNFGLPVLWQLPETAGVLSREANMRGIVSIGHEYLGAGQLSNEGVLTYADGIRSSLRHWGMLNDGKQSDPVDAQVFDGDWQLSNATGLFFLKRALGGNVRKGELIAEILPIPGSPVPLYAERDGIVLGARSKAYIREGNWAVLIGRGE